jgi:TPP-dependent 2-oxoacid decarboxylase
MLDEFLRVPNLKMITCCNEMNAGEVPHASSSSYVRSVRTSYKTYLFPLLGYAADGYARATGGIGAVMVTYM